MKRSQTCLVGVMILFLANTASAGLSTVGVFDPAGFWYLRNSNSSGGADITPFDFGAGAWTPVAGDWNGDGIDTIGVFDPISSNWYMKNTFSGGAPDIGPFGYGGGGWKPVVGHWSPEPGTAFLVLLGVAGLARRRRRRRS